MPARRRIRRCGTGGRTAERGGPLALVYRSLQARRANFCDAADCSAQDNLFSMLDGQKSKHHRALVGQPQAVSRRPVVGGPQAQHDPARGKASPCYRQRTGSVGDSTQDPRRVAECTGRRFSPPCVSHRMSMRRSLMQGGLLAPLRRARPLPTAPTRARETNSRERALHGQCAHQERHSNGRKGGDHARLRDWACCQQTADAMSTPTRCNGRRRVHGPPFLATSLDTVTCTA